MSSTDLEAPSRKLLLTAIVIVVALHVLTVIALAATKTPELKINKKDAPPIEIELISLPAETATPVEAAPAQEVTAVAPEEPRPPVVEQPQPEPKPKPVEQPKPKTPAKPVVTETKVQPVAAPKETAPKEPLKRQEVKEKPREPLVDPKIAEAAANEQRKIIAAKAERAAQQAQAQAALDAQAARDAQAQAARDAQAAKAAADAKAAAEAKAAKEAAARAQAEAAKAAAAASNTPVNFTATNANWASAPSFSFPDRAARRASPGDVLEVVLVLRVNKQGGIDSVRLAKSSGNTLLDKEAQRQVRSGRFKPFMKNGAPVVGNVTLPIAYKVP